jgi:hypothetical protein
VILPQINRDADFSRYLRSWTLGGLSVSPRMHDRVHDLNGWKVSDLADPGAFSYHATKQ